MDSNTTTALIGVGGTALGAFVSSLFNYLSKGAEHKIFIKRFRAERTFAFCEQLIAHVLRAEYAELIEHNREKASIYHLLKDKDQFVKWYAQFEDTWYSKQYLLDEQSLKACEKLSKYMYALIDSQDQLMRASSLKRLTQEQMVKVTKELRPLLLEVHESLQSFLQHGIDNV